MKISCMFRRVALILSLALIITVLPIVPMAHAATGGVQDRLNQMLKEYPQGTYFSVNGKACTHGTQGTCNNCNLVKILDSKGESIPGQGSCWTCLGFATYVFYRVFGKGLNRYDYLHQISAGNLNSTSTYASAKPGDIIFMYLSSTSGDREYKHEAVYMGKTSDGVILFDSNIGGPNKVHYGEVKLNKIVSDYGGKTYCKIYRANNYDEVDSIVACDHSFETLTRSSGLYPYAAVCKKCGYEYLVQENIFSAKYEATESGRALCSAPYQDAKTGRTTTIGEEYSIVAYANNAYGSRWCKTSDNYWIYAGYLKYKAPQTDVQNSSTSGNDKKTSNDVNSNDIKQLASRTYPITTDEVCKRIEAYNRVITNYKNSKQKVNVFWNAEYETNDLVKQVNNGDYTTCLTFSPCEATDRTKHNSGTQCQSNRFGGVSLGGRQCSGFADYIAYIIFGTTNASDFSKIENLNEIPDFTFQPGDIIRYTVGGFGHSGVVYKVSGDNMITLNCNLTSSATNNCFITLNDDIKVSTIKSRLIAVYVPKAHLRSGGTQAPINTTPEKTSITFNSLTTPGNLTVGDKGHIDGSVTSTNSPITSVIAEIRNASTGQTVRTATTNGFSLYTYGPIKGSKLDKDLSFESLSAGTYLISYTAKCKDGTQATRETSTFAVFAPAATESPKATIISFNSITTPGNLIVGNGGHIDGSISSSNSPIISVRAEVYSSSTGSAVMSAKTSGFSLPTYGPIKNSKLDNDLSFGSLGAGTYYIRYTVNCKDGTQATRDTAIFTISSPTVVETLKTTSITFNSLTTPGNLTVGNGGHIDGYISSSNSPITSVRADVYNSSTGSIVMSAYTSGFSLPSYGPIKGSKLDNDLTFGSLSAGSYFIQYTVTCVDGTQRSDATSTFQVSAPASTPTSPSRSLVVSFNSLTTPGNLKVGNGAHIDGSITSSGAPIVVVRAYVIDESNGDVVLSASTSGFSLSTYGPIRGSKIDNELTFGSLPVGTYHIHYAVSLSDGTLEVGITSSFQVYR